MSTTTDESVAPAADAAAPAPAPFPVPAGPKVAPSGELCFRQVHPNFWSKGRLSQMAFRLKANEGGLSISLESKTTAAAAFDLYTKPKAQGGNGLPACGTWAVTTEECAKEGCDVHEDPTPTDAAHGDINMRHVLKEEDKRLKKAIETNLRVYAEERKFVYSPGPEPIGV